MFHQANAIAEVLRHDMENQQETLRNDMENQQHTILAAMSNWKTESSKPPTPSKEDSTKRAILDALVDLKSCFKVKKRTGGPRNQRLKHYCWSHGRCNHQSKDCRNKKEGHKDNATLKDKKGGSTKNCNPQEA